MNSNIQPNLLNVPVEKGRSFDLRHEIVRYFTNPWHFHPEVELNFVVSGTGSRFIGGHAGRFSEGEIILLGRNLPHYWKSDENDQSNGLHSEAIVVRFLENFAGLEFFWLPEMVAIRELLVQAKDGLKLLDPLRTTVAKLMLSMPEMDDFGQMLTLLQILQMIAKSKDLEPISPDYVAANRLDKKDKRLHDVMAYLLENVTGNVQLAVAAELANMNEAAFCRYFKSKTGKTLTQFTTELRMTYAANLLVSGDDSVTEVCFRSGFENVSHFIQTFKRYRGMTPFEFRKEMKGNSLRKPVFT